MLLVCLIGVKKSADRLLLVSKQVSFVLLAHLFHLDQGSLEHVSVVLKLHEIGLIIICIFFSQKKPR